MVIGVVLDMATTETLLNNLVEADFELSDISVVMNNATQRAQVADDAGPLQGVAIDDLADRLMHAGLAHDEANIYAEAVRAGKVVVAINTAAESEAAAREMLLDHAAQQVKGWH